MKIEAARLAGLQAFESGKGRAPALNAEFTKAICAQKETPINDLLTGYLYGWDVANLASSAIPGAPSLETYSQIMEAAKC